MRWTSVLLLLSLAVAACSAADAKPAREGKRVLVLLDNAATKETHSVFFGLLEGEFTENEWMDENEERRAAIPLRHGAPDWVWEVSCVGVVCCAGTGCAEGWRGASGSEQGTPRSLDLFLTQPPVVRVPLHAPVAQCDK